MTGQMNDNPADSLRRELIEALMRKRGSQVAGRRRSDADAILDRVMPLVSAALEAARADERERTLQDAFSDAQACCVVLASQYMKLGDDGEAVTTPEARAVLEAAKRVSRLAARVSDG